ncbi:NAD(P)H dehydrogenase (quinone) [Thermodesulfobium acidiphilum]|uniref:NAD(P)H dehydrogenase (quinone) n=1 Tax=Thermodesulfobium acidiphilum TaxID=1794699 RepID=A0A2R4W0K5_THEAF|nr:NAD(P)H:quinone oxidoreductase [Thermodesulfobium acidiphilum]AWB10282.1 NAD(P)H dehydrogenase (quinone) [Thermodesulfobium acidiphilum]PMP85801.1 MAG: NAD(P)H:quinone oxidoreductase [Thermodesulfobium narugense]
MAKVLIVYYSLYGHVHRLAKAISSGAGSVEGTQVSIKRVPETLSDDIIEKMGAKDIQQKIRRTIPEVSLDDLTNSDAIVFGTPTRFGNMCAQMKTFLDSTGGIWSRGELFGKVGSVFTSSNTQHGGQESTILTFLPYLFHQGMIIVGLPYLFKGQTIMSEITGCSPYGASCVAGENSSRSVSQNEVDGAFFQGKYVALITKNICENREQYFKTLVSLNNKKIKGG